MPGNWSITPRADGTVLTAAIYNADHQAVVDNFEPAKMDDYSPDLSTLRTATQATEGAMPATLAGEVAALRYEVLTLKGALQGSVNPAYWYTVLATPRVARVGARIKRATDQALAAGTATVVSFSSAEWDSSAFWSAGSPTRLTVPVTGTYLVIASAVIAQNSPVASDYANLAIRKNGTVYQGATTSAIPVAAGQINACVSATVALAATDYMEAVALCGSAGTCKTDTGGSEYAPRLSMVYLGV